MKKSKLFTAIGSLTLSAALCLGVAAGCADNSKKDDSATATTAKDVYATSAVTGASYLSKTNKVASLASADGALAATDKTTDDPYDYMFGYLPNLKDEIMTFDKLVSGSISETVEINTDGDEKYAKYSYVMTVSVNGEETCKMYYNETSTKSETELPDEDDDDEVAEFKTSTTFEGVVVYDGGEYNVSGKRELEVEGDDSEFSVEFYTKIDDRNYIEFTYESEKEQDDHEVSYELKIVVNGRTIQESELEFETENGKTTISLKFKGGLGEFVIEKDLTDDNVYRVRYELGKTTINITVTKTDTGYKFSYAGSQEVEIPFDSSSAA